MNDEIHGDLASLIYHIVETTEDCCLACAADDAAEAILSRYVVVEMPSIASQS